MTSIQTFSALIGLWPTKSIIASDCDVDYGVVNQWDRRNRIPPDYWEMLISSAKKHDIPNVTYELLVALLVRRKQKNKSSKS